MYKDIHFVLPEQKEDAMAAWTISKDKRSIQRPLFGYEGPQYVTHESEITPEHTDPYFSVIFSLSKDVNVDVNGLEKMLRDAWMRTQYFFFFSFVKIEGERLPVLDYGPFMTESRS